jgi:hypothetical protein
MRRPEKVFGKSEDVKSNEWAFGVSLATASAETAGKRGKIYK